MPDFSKRLKELKATPLKKGEVLVICHHCTYPWMCDSDLEMVSCPSCGGKTRRVKEDK
jgi:Zn finger protein HypA/HybF involved in hydrogenase expression